MKTPPLFILFFIFYAFISCKNNQDKSITEKNTPVDEFKKASWLIGIWGNKINGIEVTEIWKKENDSLFTAFSYSISTTNDTISAERIRLEKLNNKLFYLPVVKNQNRGEVVKFALTKLTEHELVFENPEHDFPQKISYQLINEDSLFAEISGIYKGEKQSEKFPMHRIK